MPTDLPEKKSDDLIRARFPMPSDWGCATIIITAIVCYTVFHVVRMLIAG